jgi:hypothetical protein
VGHERLNEESPQVSLNVLNLLELVGALSNPLLGLGPGSVQLEQTRLASPLDKLVGLCDELGTRSEKEGESGLGGVKDTLDVVAIGKGDGGELCGRVVGCLGGERSGLDDGRASEVVVEDGLAVGLEDRLCGHCVWCGSGGLESCEGANCKRMQWQESIIGKRRDVLFVDGRGEVNDWEELRGRERVWWAVRK